MPEPDGHQPRPISLQDFSMNTAFDRRQLLQWMGTAAAASALPAWAAKDNRLWPQDSRVPGGVARLSLGPASNRPTLSFNDAPVLVLGDMIEWTAIVGIPLSTAPGQYPLQPKADGQPREIMLTVQDKKYVEQRLRSRPRPWTFPLRTMRVTSARRLTSRP